MFIREMGREIIKLGETDVPFNLSYEGDNENPVFHRDHLLERGLEWINEKAKAPYSPIAAVKICQVGEVDSIRAEVHFQNGEILEEALPGGNIKYW